MKVFISVALVTLALAYGQESGPQVDTHYGKLKGAMEYSRDERMFYSFRGIPYAKAPERFQAPEIPDNWEDVKDATQPAPSCIHFDPFQKAVVGQEDCLNLNVFTPRLPMGGQDKILLPVVVYLHPGLNKFGSSEDFDPKYWMDEDVVVVIPNTRQSVFGFLNTGDMYAAGNQGLRDQVAALKWVKENIENFGGDKSRVTIMGSSSGGADAFLHTLSPQSKGLIHNVISMGGSPLSRLSLIRNPVKQAKKLGKQLGCSIESSMALVTCLKEKDAKEILKQLTKVDLDNIKTEDIIGKAWFGPTIDKIVSEGQTEEDLVIPNNPLELLKEGKISNKVPLIIGANEKEGITPLTLALLKKPEYMEKLDKKWDEIAPLLFIYNDTASDRDALSSKLRQFYFGDKEINKDTFIQLSEMFMDRFIGFPIVAAAKLYSKTAPVYLYYFKHNPEFTAAKIFGVDENFGMTHFDELQYLFHIKPEIKGMKVPEITKDSKEYELSKGLVKLLGSFAETGKPTKTWGEAKEWKKNEGGELPNWYKIGPVTELAEAPEAIKKRVDFWKELYGNELAKEKETPDVDHF